MAIQTDGGLGVAKKALIGDDLDVDGHISYQTDISSKTSAYPIVDADNGSILELGSGAAAGRTFTMPLMSTLTSGWSIQVVNRSSFTITLTLNGTDSARDIFSEGATSPLLETQYTGCTIYYDGSDFVAIGKLS